MTNKPQDLLEACLADLENRIDPHQETILLNDWADFARGRFDGQLFIPQRKTSSLPQVKWPEIRINQALADLETMARAHREGEPELAEERKRLLCRFVETQDSDRQPRKR